MPIRQDISTNVCLGQKMCNYATRTDSSVVIKWLSMFSFSFFFFLRESVGAPSEWCTETTGLITTGGSR